MIGPAQETVLATIIRLEHQSDRIQSAVERVTALYRLFQLFDESDHRDALVQTRAGGALAICEKALLHETVLILFRLLDGKGGATLLETNRISFPIAAELVEQVGLVDAFADKARRWFPDMHPDGDAQSGKSAISDLRESIQRLKSDPERKAKLLRDFRDENLAHELYFRKPRAKPYHRHISELLDELVVLTDKLSLAVRGSTTAWEFFHEDIDETGENLMFRPATGG